MNSRLRRNVAVMLGLSAMIAIRCSSPPPLVLNPKYDGVRLTGRTMAVFPLVEVSIENKNDFEEDLGQRRPSQPDSIVAITSRLFLEAMRDRSLPVQVVYSAKPDTSVWILRDTIMAINDEQGRIQKERLIFPTPRSTVPSATGPDLGLQLCRLRFHRGKRSASEVLSIGGGKYATATTVRGGEQYLGLDGFFVLWDYKAGVPIAYGNLSEEVRFFFAMTRGEWRSAMDEAARFIVLNSPLRYSESRNPWEKAALGSTAR